MTILKVKSIFCSLVAVVMVTIFLSSCDKEHFNSIEAQNTTINDLESYKIPVPENLQASEFADWIESFNYDELLEMAEPSTNNEDNLFERCNNISYHTHTNWDCGCYPNARKNSKTYKIRECNGLIYEIRIVSNNSSCQPITC